MATPIIFPLVSAATLLRAAELDKVIEKIKMPASFNIDEVSEIIKQLIATGADVNATDEHGKTVLMKVIPKAIKPLVEAGANINATNSDGETALMNVVKANADLETIAVLIDAGADINVADNQGRTALMHAILAADWSGIKALPLLIGAGADANIADSSEKTALTLLLEKDFSELADNENLLYKTGQAMNVSKKDFTERNNSERVNTAEMAQAIKSRIIELLMSLPATEEEPDASSAPVGVKHMKLPEALRQRKLGFSTSTQSTFSQSIF